MAPMASRVPSRAEGCCKSPANAPISQQLAGLSVTSTERNFQTQPRRAIPLQTAASLRKEPNRLPRPHPKQNFMRKNIQEAPSSGRVAMPTPYRLERDVTLRSSSSGGAELEWLPSENHGSNEISMRVTAQLLIAPKSAYFVRDVVENHNNDVSTLYPRMRLRLLGDSERPYFWELIPLEEGLGPPTPGTSRKFQLKAPLIKISKPLTIERPRRIPLLRGSEQWQDYFEATGNYLQKNYMVQGVNGFLPAIFITISTLERRLDFKRIVQALIHFNQLWPKVLPCEDKDSGKADPRIVEENSYISHHPDHWSAIPATGEVFFSVRQASEVGGRSVLWTQFVLNFLLAAIDSPSLEFIQSHQVTMDGLNAFILGRPPRGDGGRRIKSLW